MKKQFLQFTAPKWIMAAVVVMILLICAGIGYSVYLYQHIEESKKADYSTSIDKALSETEMVEVEEVTRYHGTTYYHIISGETDSGTAVMAFVPIDDEKDLSFMEIDDLLNEPSILEQWNESCDNCQLLKVNPAFENEQPLWEIKYVDDSDRYVFEYVSMEDGSIYEVIRLRKSNY